MRIRHLVTALLLILVLAACGVKTFPSGKSDTGFAEFTEEIFRSQSSSDSLTLNYTLAHPENYGITSLPKGFSSFSYEDLIQEGLNLENLLASLQQFDKDSLSFKEQVLYDTLQDKLESGIQGQNYVAFSEALGPTTGIQAQLPVLLAEFSIKDKTDLSQYFSLLQTVPDYFDSLLSLEEKKSQWQTLPCRTTLDNIIAQCETFLAGSGASILEETFQKKASDFSFLEETEKQEAISRNHSCVEEYIIPAYQSLTDGLKQLIPMAGEEGSLSQYPNGRAYYQYLVGDVTGSSLSVPELRTLMTEQLETSQNTLIAYAKKDPSLFSSCQSYVTKYSAPDTILATLEKRMTEDFPLLPADSQYEVKYVDEALEDYLSPAFYLTPPVDDSENNVIYINNSDKYDRSSLFNTLAHEGYPGHLYQTCYMHSKQLPLLRYALDYGGYTEGWATYAEIYSYKYTGISKDEVGILRNNMIATLCLYGLCDIGVHYDNWDEEKLQTFLNQYGSWSSGTAAAVYSAVVDEPASYLKYTVGYLEFARLKEKMKEELGSTYSEKLFHTFALDMGPASFDILARYLPLWSAQNGCK
ncbi:MAG: DUF885 domain-containing protein [Lachnospiraceae bacterium]|nr:DUF885 domain-containing protein [Lachnospiraceae bacterium]